MTPAGAVLLVAVLLAGGCSAADAPPAASSPSGPPSPVAVTSPSVATPADAADDVLAPGEGGPSLVIGDGFTITFPVPPNDRTVEVPVGEGMTSQARIYQAQLDGVFLAFSYADAPGEGPVDEAAAEAALLDSARSAAADAAGELVAQTVVEVAGRTAVDYQIEVAGGTLRGIALFDGPRLYTMQAAGPSGAVDRVLLDDLAASLTLG